MLDFNSFSSGSKRSRKKGYHELGPVEAKVRLSIGYGKGILVVLCLFMLT